MDSNLPPHVKHAESVAKIATGVGTALAAIWFPPAALTQPILDRLIERWVRKPEKMLIEIVRERGISSLSESQFEAFVPMAYKFFEAAKQGEHNRNLRILGSFIAGELEQEFPQPENFILASESISGLSELELKVFSCAHYFIDKCLDPVVGNEDQLDLSSKLETLPGIAEPTPLLYLFSDAIGHDIMAVEDSLASLANRSLMYAVPSFDMSRPDHTGYRLTQSGRELINKAIIYCRKQDDKYNHR